MKTYTQSFTFVDFTADEVTEHIDAHLATVKPSQAVLVRGQGPQHHTKAVALTFGLTRQDIDAIVRPLIPDLPPLGEYRYIPNPDPSAPEIAARVRFTLAPVAR